MTRRIPIFATIVVLLAVATMVGLGIWQLQRASWKESLLAHYRQALTMSSQADWPKSKAEVEGALYRHATIDCAKVLSLDAVAGHNQAGETGWAQVARCTIPGAGEADVVLGWSAGPQERPQWAGGEVQGIIGPGRDGEARLIASPPLAGLQANAAPDPADIPNNHMAYAWQWFFFAATALVIYAIALRKRMRG
ncbi:threonine synthase [Erythrobacter sp. SG61-1L]|uniref:SURF1 family cytochrome oxidase biogenesis protein n=1 Tax=Erythrobacter sp. SG61-1L TaxID=1603897 RepID=UPI0006D6ECDD|nr:SURF1 family cytochrome oxidase biogenesis protein [Erythrobacter sp. SG61-1L]KPL68161.1 threonine synthase [Erythrobacter sp. SG61-1L]